MLQNSVDPNRTAETRRYVHCNSDEFVLQYITSAYPSCTYNPVIARVFIGVVVTGKSLSSFHVSASVRLYKTQLQTLARITISGGRRERGGGRGGAARTRAR